MTKEPLYRKYNKLARGFHSNSPGGSYRHERNTKELANFEGSHKSINRTNGGYDYTPLFKFLLSRIGQNWDDIFSEAASRLDTKEPIFWLVFLQFKQGEVGFIRIGESSYYSKLTVKNGLLVKADPDTLPPPKHCTCCTYTFNGVRY